MIYKIEMIQPYSKELIFDEIKDIINEKQDEEEPNKEKIYDICNKLITKQNIKYQKIAKYINILIKYPEYDFLIEKLFNTINPMNLIEPFTIFIQRNPGNISLKEINVPKLLENNDEISWNLICKIIFMPEVNFKEIFERLFNARISNQLFSELLNLSLSVIMMVPWTNHMILEFILQTKKMVTNYDFNKKSLIYQIILRKNNLFLLLFNEESISLFGNIDCNISIMLQIRELFSNDAEFKNSLMLAFSFNTLIQNKLT